MMTTAIINPDNPTANATRTYNKAVTNATTPQLSTAEQFSVTQLNSTKMKLIKENENIKELKATLPEQSQTLETLAGIAVEIDTTIMSASSGYNSWDYSSIQSINTSLQKFVTTVNTSGFFNTQAQILQVPQGPIFLGIESYSIGPTDLPVHPVFGEDNIFETQAISNLFSLYGLSGSFSQSDVIQYRNYCQAAKVELFQQDQKLLSFLKIQDSLERSNQAKLLSIEQRFPQSMRQDGVTLIENGRRLAEAEQQINQAMAALGQQTRVSQILGGKT